VLQPYSEAVASEREEKERKYVTNKCLMSLYIPLLFHTGYGFDNDSEHIYVVKDIAGEEPGICNVSYRPNMPLIYTLSRKTFTVLFFHNSSENLSILIFFLEHNTGTL